MSFPYDLLRHGVRPGDLPSSYHVTPLNTPLPSVQHLLYHIQLQPLPQILPLRAYGTSPSPVPAQLNILALIRALQRPWPSITDGQDNTNETAEEFASRMELERSKKQKLRFIEMLRDECSQLGIEPMQELLGFVEGLAGDMRGFLDVSVSQGGN